MSGFSVSPGNAEKARAILARHAEGRRQGAILDLLTLAQEDAGGWLPGDAIRHVAEMLGIPEREVADAAAFYSRFNLEPVGTHVLHVCMGRSCMLRGADKIMETCCRELGIGEGETTADGLFTIKRSGCIGGCGQAPVVVAGDDLHLGMTPEKTRELIRELKGGDNGAS